MPDQRDRLYSNVQTITSNVTLTAKGTRKVIDLKETGEIISVEFFGTNSLMAIEINVQGDYGELVPILQKDNDFQALLRRSWGLSPGEVELVGGVSPDPSGTPNYVHPYLTRYKDSTEADRLGETGTHYGMAYTPIPNTPYSNRIQVVVTNNANATATIENLVVTRRVFKSPK